MFNFSDNGQLEMGNDLEDYKWLKIKTTNMHIPVLASFNNACIRLAVHRFQIIKECLKMKIQMPGLISSPKRSCITNILLCPPNVRQP